MTKKITITTKRPWKIYIDRAKKEGKENFPKKKFKAKQIRDTAYVMAIADLDEPYNTLLDLCRSLNPGAIDAQFKQVLPSREKPELVVFETTISVSSEGTMTHDEFVKNEAKFQREFKHLIAQMMDLSWEYTIE